MNATKKTIRASLLTLSAVLMLTGCKNDDVEIERNANIEKTYSGSITVNIMDDASEKKSIDNIIEEFNREYPNITVKVEQIPGNYMQGVISRVQARNIGDVVQVTDEALSYFAQKNVLYNLDPYMEESGFDKSLYFDSMLKLGQKNQNGSQYMMPRDYNKIVCYYNKDLLEEFGIDQSHYPHQNWTYSEFLTLCQDIIDNRTSPDIYPVDAMLNWHAVYNAFIRSFGGQLMTPDGQPAFDSTGARQGLDAMKNLIQSNYTIKPTQKTEDIFFSEKSVMFFANRPILSNAVTAGFNFNVATFPQVGTNPCIGAGTSGYGISKRAKDPNAAWAFINFLMSKDGQQAFSRSGNAVPVLKSLANDEDNDAIWCTVPDVQSRFNHKAFVEYEERDVLKDYLNGVNIDLSSSVDNALITLFNKYEGWDAAPESPDKAISDAKSNIIRILNSD